MRKFSILLLVLVGFGLLTACSALAPKIDPPQLKLVSVGMVSGDMFSQQFNVRLHVQNTNDRDLPVDGIEYQLFLGGDSFAEGNAARPFVVPAKGDTEFDMIVRTNFVSSIGRLLSRANGKDKIDYIFEGKVHTNLGVVRKVPFQQSGVVDLKVFR